MKNMMLTLAILPALAVAARAQDVAWRDLAQGDRVEVTFHSGATIGGTLVAPRPKMETVDYARESALTLDVTWEYPGLNGTMTVPTKEIRSVRKLRVLDQKTLENFAKIKAQIAADNAKATATKVEAPPKEPVVNPETPGDRAKREAAERARKEAEELKKATDFYAKFPPPYWGPERHTMDLQKQVRGQAWSPAEREFEEGYSTLWEKGRATSVKPEESPKK